MRGGLGFMWDSALQEGVLVIFLVLPAFYFLGETGPWVIIMCSLEVFLDSRPFSNP